MLSMIVLKRVRCIDGLGCFHSEWPFFDPPFRIISLIPEARETINTTFALFTRRNRFHPQYLKAEFNNIKRSAFSARKSTIFLVHGFYYNNFAGSYQQPLFSKITQSLLDLNDCNVIMTEWGNGATTWYHQSVANTRVVGAEVAFLINFLIKNFNAIAESFRIIGHSLGAHIAGYAGERVRNLGRITALDPAKPSFDNTQPNVRLDHNDALFVDVIHTNSPNLLKLGITSIILSLKIKNLK
ncbi:pancreatic triacylglycerol lipase-like protein [Dinothrombium tinctorium]|uniref:Pancreatic triacylglycerol lipase-like protein n=1 Tax=Dinothrombium tinctorium TaxID=1965070 RepID=A0A443RFT0_9ACAR|nr:pancreatic triacylglycerol lipase-like protein [Dinothrombium tinctorium]